ncbi:MAG TPA: NAD(P)H-binding protein [Candidatus Limnocylindrales bacterium]|nr:NAD(P)H-binding protein [Candidatus Limnocylindrales bacterium]
MKIAITGGTGFVGSHLAQRLIADGYEVVVIGRTVRGAGLPTGVRLVRAEITDAVALEAAFRECDAVAHCAGINREIGEQTYQRIHVEGTRAVAAASRAAGVQRLVMLSFLRARPDGPTAYHRTKWEAEELVRGSGLTWTILKAGVIHGRGDHMLDHLSHAFFTFPIFGLVGLHERNVRPVAVDDVARVLEAAVLGDPRLADRTVAVLGPEELPLGQAVRRVAAVTGRHPTFVRLPIWAHLAIGRVAELLMRVPLVSLAQVRILQEGVTVAAPSAEPLPPDLAPSTPFSEAVIRTGLPSAGGFGRADLRWCAG